MSERIEIRGVIVSSMYDAYYWQSWIDRGIITPESHFRKMLAAANGDVVLYINSPGGSVMAGNEMINAIKAFLATGRKMEITIGAIAASMAANIVAMSGVAKVKAHKNSKIMYHGSMTWTEGGADAHGDTKKLLDAINGDVIAALKSKGITDCEAWFAEGRDHWLTAQEALEMELVDEIVDATDLPPLKMDKAASARMLADGFDAAAFEIPESEAPASPSDTRWREFQAKKDKEVAEANAATHKAEADAAVAIAAKQNEVDAANATITDLQAQLAAKTTEFEGAITSFNAEVEAHEKTKSTLDETVEQLNRVTANHEKLTASVFSQFTQSVEITNWSDAVKQFGYAQARKKCPELYAAFMSGATKKGI